MITLAGRACGSVVLTTIVHWGGAMAASVKVVRVYLCGIEVPPTIRGNFNCSLCRNWGMPRVAIQVEPRIITNCLLLGLDGAAIRAIAPNHRCG